MDPHREKVKFVQKDGITGAKLQGWWAFKGGSDLPSQAPPGQAVVGMLLRVHAAMTSAEASR
jgi:hypothetical protein